MSYKPGSLNEAVRELRRIIDEGNDEDEERLAVIDEYLDGYVGRAREGLAAQVDELIERAANVSENQPK